MTNLRTIALRLHGHTHGPITRLISPDEIGDRLKPFIFLDFFSAEITPGFGFPMHPHSGIATLTWQPGTDVRYTDTTGKNGVLKAGGLEWMNAGGGAWHKAQLMGRGLVTGFQLWTPLPPGVEDGPSFGQYVPPEEVPVYTAPGVSAKVFLGALDGAASPIDSHQDMTYFAVSLAQGSTWLYQPPPSHDVAFAFAFDGEPTIQGELTSRALLVMSGSGGIALSAPTAPAAVLIGSAKRHDHPLVVGTSSVHTNPASLARSAERIRALRPV
jgi:redox-sensitive bicupin YhaK (pirin superfamily)